MDVEKLEKLAELRDKGALTQEEFETEKKKLLNSEANKKLISILEKEDDYVIFDCVPINGLPDSLIMANLVNKAIIVCAAGVTPTELLQKTKTSLENVDAEIAGIVINKTKGSYNKYYGHYYG